MNASETTETIAKTILSQWHTWLALGLTLVAFAAGWARGRRRRVSYQIRGRVHQLRVEATQVLGAMDQNDGVMRAIVMCDPKTRTVAYAYAGDSPALLMSVEFIRTNLILAEVEYPAEPVAAAAVDHPHQGA